MSTLVTKKAPEFKATAVMEDGSFKDVSLTDYKGQFVLLYFYPLDFTFVCPSEILAFNKKVSEFKEKNVQLLGVSIDSHFSHLAWRNTPIEKGGIGTIDYPLIADVTKNIARDYGILFNESVALRGLFLIDTDGVVRHSTINDLPLGRNVDEALRMVDALQFHETHGEVCPANWKKGDEAMKPTAEGVATYLAKHSK
ncbi:MAG: peroxiredoxin [Halobacteriovoraceae bacterium]|jgi:peroxiredoxin 2/4|nr:peroxiredoxin [Halobacteriovoraceae bacterium]